MFDAYAAYEVALKLPQELTAIYCEKSSARICGTLRNGEIFAFVQKHGPRKFELEFCRKFSRNPVKEFQICEREEIFLAASDGRLAAYKHTGDKFGAVNFALKAKPLHSFVAWNFKGDDNLYILMSVKRQLLLYKWMNDDFLEIQLTCDKTFSDTPANLRFCGDCVVFNTRDEYLVLTFKEAPVVVRDEEGEEGVSEAWEGKVTQLANVADFPVIVDLRDKNMIGITRGDTLHVYEKIDDRFVRKSDVRFSEVPLNIVYDAPYLIALFSKGRLEIKSLTNPPILIQNLAKFGRVEMLANGVPGQVYVAGPKDLWVLDANQNIRQNLNKLIEEKYFDLAIKVVEMSSVFSEDTRSEVKRQASINFFKLKKFEEAFALHQEIGTDILKIIKMFPELLPPEMPERAQLTSAIEDLPANDKKRALLALGNYLSAIRAEYSNKQERHRKALTGKSNIAERMSDDEASNLNLQMAFIDTALLNIYLKTKPMLVDSLLRVAHNGCNFEDAETILKQANRLSSVFVLYETRKKHDLALELLYQQAHNPECEPMFKGRDKTIEYLQSLGNADLPLVFNYSRWVMKADLDEGLQIFIGEESDLAKNLDREKVLAFLKSEFVAAVVPYLEHVIYKWEELRPMFHEALVEHYVIKVKSLMQDYVHICKDEENIPRAGDEEGELGSFRSRLIKFLQVSHSYNAHAVLMQLSSFPLYEERALVLGRLKQHEQALTIYCGILHDFKSAEEYCQLYYDKNDHANSMVYIEWFRAYLVPSDPSVIGVSETELPIPIPDVKNAIKVLSRHAEKIDTVMALSLIPNDTSLRILANALNAVLQTIHDQSSSWKLRDSICATALEKAEERLYQAEMTRIPVTNASECVKCSKKIGNSAFVRFPTDGSLAHFYCFN